MAHTYSHLFGLSREISEAFHWELPTTGLRFFTVYGPCLSREMRSKFQREGRPDMALFLFTKAILEDKPIKVFNNGNMVRDFTYIDDIVEGVVRVIDSPPHPEKFLAHGSARELATDAASSHQHNANSGPHESGTDASQSSPQGS
jgi:UDP-glucuronate 4-epimerase